MDAICRRYLAGILFLLFFWLVASADAAPPSQRFNSVEIHSSLTATNATNFMGGSSIPSTNRAPFWSKAAGTHLPRTFLKNQFDKPIIELRNDGTGYDLNTMSNNVIYIGTAEWDGVSVQMARPDNPFLASGIIPLLIVSL